MAIEIDFEVFSKVDLKEVGLFNYANDPTSDIICMAYKLSSNDETKLWKPGEETPPFPAGFSMRAHNIAFEKAIFEHIAVPKYGMQMPGKFECTAAKAAYMTYPRSLEKAAEALNLPVKKDTKGKSTMLRVTKPRTPTKNNPETTWFFDKEKMEAVYKYCIQDVNVESEINKKLETLPNFEEKIFKLDSKINERGVYIDKELAESAIELTAMYIEYLNDQIFWASDCRISSVSKVGKVKTFLYEKYGLEIHSLSKSAIRELLLDPKVPNGAKNIIKLRELGSKTSTAKYKKIINWSGKDNRIKHILLYGGASTMRWAGKGPQLHNLPRGLDINKKEAIKDIKSKNIDKFIKKYEDPMGVISSCIRETFTAKPGYTFVAADFASIEVRVLAWYANEESLLEILRKGGDPYIDMAASIYKIKCEKVTKNQRLMGKIAVLGLGYGMGAKTFKSQCAAYGVNITEEFAKKVIKIYRNKYKKIKKFWRDIESAIITAMTNGEEKNEKLLVKKEENNVKICLPSGRDIWYIDAGTTKNKWGETAICHKTVNQTTNQWVTRETYGGMLTENIIQAFARDLLASAMLRIEPKLDIVLHIHDEIVTEVPKEKEKEAKKQLKKLMETVPKWAKGCPIEVDVWSDNRFKKG